VSDWLTAPAPAEASRPSHAEVLIVVVTGVATVTAALATSPAEPIA
jgi:hypothetical protein